MSPVVHNVTEPGVHGLGRQLAGVCLLAQPIWDTLQKTVRSKPG